GGDLLARREGDESTPTEDFEPGERFERPRRTDNEAPEAPGAEQTFRAGEVREDARRPASEEPPERPRRGRHRAPKRGEWAARGGQFRSATGGAGAFVWLSLPVSCGGGESLCPYRCSVGSCPRGAEQIWLLGAIVCPTVPEFRIPL